MIKSKQIFTFLIFLLIPQLFALIGAYFTTPAISGWYATLIKSPLNPPSWVFAPVWTILFLLMGVAAYLVWMKRKTNGFPPSALNLRGNDKTENRMDPRVRKDDKRIKIALAIFGVQLVLNTLWSILFFGMHSPGMALVEIFFLWLAILATVITFYRVSKPASYLLLPYLFWVSFAMILNYSIWNLNQDTQNYPGGGVACTMEAKLCPDGSAVGRTGPNCEFAACPSGALGEGGNPAEALPQGYTIDSYKIEKVTGESCLKKADCQTPGEYLIQSRCPFVSLCLANKCTVVCPDYRP
ncbi:MAG: TspO/MBR family protein [Patescibacteria group bacterium]|jgi:tryptophan-rich sensory protein